MYKRKLGVLTFCLIIAVFLTSCYHFESNQTTEYQEFYQKLKENKKQIYNFFPIINDKESIQEVYLFYNDRDLIDTYYTIYLNCNFSKDDYQKEKDRIAKLFEDKDLLVENSDSFEYESLMYDSTLYPSKYGDIDLMSYEYALFLEDEQRIVYVAFFDKELNGKSINIPKEYLPKELLELRDKFQNKY